MKESNILICQKLYKNDESETLIPLEGLIL